MSVPDNDIGEVISVSDIEEGVVGHSWSCQIPTMTKQFRFRTRHSRLTA